VWRRRRRRDRLGGGWRAIDLFGGKSCGHDFCPLTDLIHEGVHLAGVGLGNSVQSFLGLVLFVVSPCEVAEADLRRRCGLGVGAVFDDSLKGLLGTRFVAE
jgi:hypothetical protein